MRCRLAVLPLLVAGAAHGAAITYQFAGELTEVTPGSGAFVGERFSGSLEWDASVAPTSCGFDTCFFEHVGALTVNLGTFSFTDTDLFASNGRGFTPPNFEPFHGLPGPEDELILSGAHSNLVFVDLTQRVFA